MTGSSQEISRYNFVNNNTVTSKGRCIFINTAYVYTLGRWGSKSAWVLHNAIIIRTLYKKCKEKPWMKWISKALLISPLHLNLMNLKCTSHYWSEHTFSGRVPGFFQYFTSPSLHSFIRLSTQFVSIKHDLPEFISNCSHVLYHILPFVT